MPKRLVKSSDKMIAGVCGGIANYLNIDPTIVRIAYVLLSVCTAFMGVIAYLIMAIIMPNN